MDRATITVAAGRPAARPEAPLNEPVEFASALTAGGRVEYTRHDARNSRALESVLGALEGGEAVLFASGMAAVTAVLEVCAPDAVATPTVVYSGTAAALTTRGLRRCEQSDPAADLRWIEPPPARSRDRAVTLRSTPTAPVRTTWQPPALFVICGPDGPTSTGTPLSVTTR